MPAMRWMHITWHLPSDAVPVVAFSLLLINSLWLILYFVLILSLSKPCPPGHSHTAESLAIVWGLLAFLVANVLTSLLLIILGCCGTPFTPSKRWLVPYVLYFDFFKYVAAIGFVTWGLVVTIDASSRDEPCWAPTKHKNIEILLWCTISVFVLVLAVIVLSYDVLAKKDPENRWQIRVKMIARLLGCYQVLRSAGTQQPTDDGEEGGGGGGPVAGSRSVMKADEEIGKFLARVYGTVDMEKSDFALGLVLASVLQAHQRRRLMVERMIDKGIVPSPKIKTLAEEGDSIALARRGSTRPDVVVIRIHPDAMADGHGPSEDESEGGAHSSEVDDSPGSAFQEWLRAVNEGSKVIIAPVSMEAAVAPSMRMSERSALYTEPCSPVDGQMLNEAREWAVYAAATYGRTAFIEKETHEEQISGWKARAKLAWAQVHKRLNLDRVPEPVRSKLRQNETILRHYVAGQRAAGVPDENVVYVSYANEALGSTPYFIILRPERRAVCMCIRGTASFADLVTDLVGRPVDFKDWLPSSFVEEHNIQDARAHAGILAAAKAVLRDLNRHQILHTLLTGRPKEESSVDQDGAEPHSGRRTPEDFQRLLAERGIDCRGWDLYVCGHSLGAAIASLLLPHFAEWAPGKVIAWAFNPPGGLITQEVAAALEPRSKDVGVTSVIVGKDIISRTSNITFEHLQDQIVVALARTRLSKLGGFMRFWFSSLRKLPSSTVFYPEHAIPKEALHYVKQYFAAKTKFTAARVTMVPPGRCIYLRRLKGQDRRCWDAVWIKREHIVEEGILLSRHQNSDHYIHRLKNALESAAEHWAEA